jgi:hypothetical protein
MGSGLKGIGSSLRANHFAIAQAKVPRRVSDRKSP